MKAFLIFLIVASAAIRADVNTGEVISCPEAISPLTGSLIQTRDQRLMLDQHRMDKFIFWEIEQPENESIRFRRLIAEFLRGGGQLYAYLTLAELEFRAFARMHDAIRVAEVPAIHLPLQEGRCKFLRIIQRPKVRLSNDPPILVNSIYWNVFSEEERALVLLRFLLGEIADRLPNATEVGVDRLMLAVSTGQLREMTTKQAEAYIANAGFPNDQVFGLPRPY